MSFGEHVFFFLSVSPLNIFFCLFTPLSFECLSEPFQAHQHLNCNSKEAPLCEPETLCRRLCRGSQMTQKQTCVRACVCERACVGVCGFACLWAGASLRVQVRVLRCRGGLMQSDKSNLQFLFLKERKRDGRISQMCASFQFARFHRCVGC